MVVVEDPEMFLPPEDRVVAERIPADQVRGAVQAQDAQVTIVEAEVRANVRVRVQIPEGRVVVRDRAQAGQARVVAVVVGKQQPVHLQDQRQPPLKPVAAQGKIRLRLQPVQRAHRAVVEGVHQILHLQEVQTTILKKNRITCKHIISLVT